MAAGAKRSLSHLNGMSGRLGVGGDLSGGYAGIKNRLVVIAQYGELQHRMLWVKFRLILAGSVVFMSSTAVRHNRVAEQGEGAK